jgi:hypothetical protein
MAAIYAILDVPKQMQAIKRNTMHMEFAPAFFLFLVCFLLLFPFLYLFWTYDLSSTWIWTGAIGLRDPNAETFRNGIVAAIDTATPGMAASLLIWAFTWMPSLIEMGFPRIAHGAPGIAIGLKACIAFDYFTDLPLVWGTVHGDETHTGWLVSWGFAQLPGQVLVTTLLTVVTSLVLQVVIVLLAYTCLRLFITMFIGSLKGDHRGPTVVFVDEERVGRAQLEG